MLPQHETLAKEKVNIREYPQKIRGVQPPNIFLTVGDIHGNAMKLLWILMREGAIEMTEENFKKMCKVYDDSDNPDYFEGLQKNWEELLENITIKNPNFNLRLIGDVFADRGKNDYLTLKVFEKLHNKGIKSEFMYSNHDELLLDEYNKTPAEWIPWLQIPDQQYSMLSLLNFLSCTPTYHQGVKTLVEQSVLPQMKLISYSLSQDGTKIDLFMHAPNDFAAIAILAQVFSVENFEEKSKSATGLAGIIDEINKKFTDFIKEGKTYPLSVKVDYTKVISEYLKQTLEGKSFLDGRVLRYAIEQEVTKYGISIAAAKRKVIKQVENSTLTLSEVLLPPQQYLKILLSFFTWNRFEKDRKNEIDLNSYPNYVTSIVHGHVGETGFDIRTGAAKQIQIQVNLDTHLGMYIPGENNDRGTYKVLTTMSQPQNKAALGWIEKIRALRSKKFKVGTDSYKRLDDVVNTAVALFSACSQNKGDKQVKSLFDSFKQKVATTKDLNLGKYKWFNCFIIPNIIYYFITGFKFFWFRKENPIQAEEFEKACNKILEHKKVIPSQMSSMKIVPPPTSPPPKSLTSMKVVPPPPPPKSKA